MTRADRLTAFCEAIGTDPVIWGSTDCSACPAAWMAAERGIDIKLPAYASREEAQQVIAAYGGLANVWSEIADRHGIRERYGDPELGDVAVIDTRLYGEIGGICAQGRILIIRRDTGGWHMLGPVRNFVKVFAVE